MLCFIYCTQILKILQVLVNCDVAVSGGSGLIGQALVPYYRQILPIFNIFINDNENLGKLHLFMVFIVFACPDFLDVILHPILCPSLLLCFVLSSMFLICIMLYGIDSCHFMSYHVQGMALTTLRERDAT